MRNLRPVPDTPPRAVLYLRQSVSRDDSISIELQEIAGRDYCMQHGYEVVAVEVDAGLSGRNWSKRPAVQRVMDMVEAKSADVIVLWKWSRLSRNRRDWAIAADRVDVAGGRIESATEPIDTATASGRFARGVMTEYAAFQSEQIGEQWNEVHQRRLSLGLPPNGVIPWGWVSHKTWIEPHPERAPFVAELYARYLAGDGWGRLTEWMNSTEHLSPRGKAWTEITIRALLDSPIHAGFVTYRGEIHDGAHEGIIGPDQWEAYRAMRQRRTIPMKKRASDYLLSSLVVCHCGNKRSGKITRNRHRDGSTYEVLSYACYKSSHKQMSVVTRRVDGAVGAWLKSEANTPAKPPARKSREAETKRLSREIIELDKQLTKATRQMLAGIIPDVAYHATVAEIEDEKKALQKRLTGLSTSGKPSKVTCLAGQTSLIDTWEAISLDDRQSVVRATIESVTINMDQTITIVARWGDISVMDI